MHETSQQKRVNNSMSINSSMVASSKSSAKKNPFYVHQDPSKLNYYARFSPKRKLLNQSSQQNILSISSPISSRISRASSSQKEYLNSAKKQFYQKDTSQKQINTFKLIDPLILISQNNEHQNRTQIYIDDEDESQENQNYFQKGQNQTNVKGKNDMYQPKFCQQKNLINNQILQNAKESSQSQQSSSFQRMIEPSSSSDNEIPQNLFLKKSGGQMLIEDDEESESQKQITWKNKVQTPLKITNNSQKILQLVKSIGAQNQNETERKQIKSENISFSIDSDLSEMQLKWNSFFESKNQEASQLIQPCSKKINSSSLIYQKNNYKVELQSGKNQCQSSSEEQLPSFSHPDTSNYYITPLESQRSSNCSEEPYNFINFDGNTQTKQFKRQFTFGNQLKNAYQEEEPQNQTAKQSKQPLFKRFMQKSTIQNFKNQKNQKTQKQKQKHKAINDKKISFPQDIKSKKVVLSEKYQTKKDQKFISTIKMNKPILQVIKDAHQPESLQRKQSQKLIQESQYQSSQILQGNQILIMQQQAYELRISQQEKIKSNNSVSFEKQRQVDKFQKIGKSDRKLNWEQTLRSSTRKQAIKNEPIFKSQNIQKLHQNTQKFSAQIKIQDECESQQQNYQQQNKKKECNLKTIKNEQPSSYSKIFSEKKFYKMRKGSYNDRPKISESQYQSSQDEDMSQKNNKYSQPKSQTGESMTTATQEINQNKQISPHYFIKSIENSKVEVQNLKKYLEKIQNSPLSKKQNNERKQIFDLNQNFQSDQQSKSQLFQDSFHGQSQNHKDKTYQFFQQAQQQKFKFSKAQQTPKKDLLPQSIHKQSKILSSNEQYETPMKKILIQNQNLTSQFKNQLKKQPQQGQIQYSTSRSFQNSLSMIQQAIRESPNQLSKIYEKIYTQVYEQELRYQQKIEKQQFLMSLMTDYLIAEKQKIDCQSFLNHQFQSDNNQSQEINDQNASENKLSLKSQKFQSTNESQILINKHIILALVRHLGES